MRREQEREATDKMRADEISMRRKRAEIIAGKLTVAREAFASRDFRGAISICETVLIEDPRNELAIEIREASVSAENQRKTRTSSARASSVSASSRSTIWRRGSLHRLLHDPEGGILGNDLEAA